MNFWSICLELQRAKPVNEVTKRTAKLEHLDGDPGQGDHGGIKIHPVRPPTHPSAAAVGPHETERAKLEENSLLGEIETAKHTAWEWTPCQTVLTETRGNGRHRTEGNPALQGPPEVPSPLYKGENCTGWLSDLPKIIQPSNPSERLNKTARVIWIHTEVVKRLF